MSSMDLYCLLIVVSPHYLPKLLTLERIFSGSNSSSLPIPELVALLIPILSSLETELCIQLLELIMKFLIIV